MMRLDRILRDYADAGALNAQIALWGFVDDHTFLTKGGHVGLAYRVHGRDADGLTHEQRRGVVHQMEAALRLLDERCRVYQYVLKHQAPMFTAVQCARPVAREALVRRAEFLNARRVRLFTIDQFLVLMYEPPTAVQTRPLGEALRAPHEAVREWFSPARRYCAIEGELDRAIATLHHKAAGFEAQLADIKLERLDKHHAFAFFRRLVNYDQAVAENATLTHDAHLDYFIADSTVECHRDHLTIGGHAVKVLTMKEPPAQTFAHMLGDLMAVPGEFVGCLEWQRLPGDRVRRDIQSRRRHFFNKRVSIVNYVSSETRPEEMLVDDSASATVRQLGDALTEVEVNGHFFGLASLTLVLIGADSRALERSAADMTKVIAAHDGAAFEESYNLLNAWLAIIPGNGACNLRRLALLETNCADMSFLFTLDSGEPTSRFLDKPAVVAFETPADLPYWFNLHVDDVGHTLVLGATGSGKSFLLNVLVTHLQQYDPVMIVLDLGHSYRKLAGLLQGGYLELGLGQQDVTINPFDLVQPSPEELHFLHAFTRVLLEGEDGYRLSDAEDRETYEAVENLFVLDPAQRRLFTLANLLPRALGTRLHKWIQGGRYGALFDNVHDTLPMNSLQVFDFESMREYPSLLEPLLFYVLHRVDRRIHDRADDHRLKVCVMDEAWRLIQHPLLRAYLQEALKTWRKRNAAVLLATQAIDDFASADLLRTVVESCPTRLLLSNPSLDPRQYGDLFQMNEMELELLCGLTPRQQLLLKRPNLTKVLTLRVDPKSYWIYTNTPADNERVAAMLRETSLVEGIDRLAASA
jgi:type IV secretion system protein TrbE